MSNVHFLPAPKNLNGHGRAVGVLAPPDFLRPSERDAGDKAWERLAALADQLGMKGGRRKSAVQELELMRR